MKTDLNIQPIQNIVNQFVDAVKGTLQRNGSNASGDLAKSIKGNVKVNGKWVEISVSMEDYWKYVEYGRKPGKFPPIDAIKMWIDVKPILPRAINGKLPTKPQLAFLIARKIAQKGIKPKPFLYNTMDKFKLVENLYDVVAEELQKQIQNELDEEL